MLTMKRMSEGDKQTLLTSLGIVGSENFVYEAKEGEKPLGYAVFQNIDGRPTLVSVSYGEDEGLFDGLIRAGMAWLDDNGFDTLFFAEGVDRQLLQKYWFITDQQEFVKPISDFLRTCHGCKSGK